MAGAPHSLKMILCWRNFISRQNKTYGSFICAFIQIKREEKNQELIDQRMKMAKDEINHWKDY